MDMEIMVEDTDMRPQATPEIDEGGIGDTDASPLHAEVNNLLFCHPTPLQTCICMSSWVLY